MEKIIGTQEKYCYRKENLQGSTNKVHKWSTVRIGPDIQTNCNQPIEGGE